MPSIKAKFVTRSYDGRRQSGRCRRVMLGRPGSEGTDGGFRSGVLTGRTRTDRVYVQSRGADAKVPLPPDGRRGGGFCGVVVVNEPTTGTDHGTARVAGRSRREAAGRGARLEPRHSGLFFGAHRGAGLGVVPAVQPSKPTIDHFKSARSAPRNDRRLTAGLAGRIPNRESRAGRATGRSLAFIRFGSPRRNRTEREGPESSFVRSRSRRKARVPPRR